jgi:hypothetical protein
MIEAPDLEGLMALDGRDIVANAMGLFESYQPTDVARQDYLPGSQSVRRRQWPYDRLDRPRR